VAQEQQEEETEMTSGANQALTFRGK